ncbi:MAG TPA: error-prone DNA polymerase [Burkholderiales bacterium]|nr:error-prone DNA polymerase [Burkholderiales bacterium]
MLPSYAELHCISNFTFLRGASHPHELVGRAAELGYSALAITDECSLAGVVRAHVAAGQYGLKLIVGSELRIAAPSIPSGHGAGNQNEIGLVLLARDREGYGDLCALITRGRRAADKGRYRLTRADFENGLTHCLALWLPEGEPDEAAARWLASRFPGRLWIAVELLARASDRAWLERLQALGAKLGLPCVAAGDVHMHVRGRRLLQDTLTAIRLGVPVAKVGYGLHPNGERHLRRRETLARLYPRALLEETVHIAGLCEFSLNSLRYEYPEEIVPAGETPTSCLRRLTEEGLRWRFGGARMPGERRESRCTHAEDADKCGNGTMDASNPRTEAPAPHSSLAARHSSSLTPDSSPLTPDPIPARVRALVEHELALIAELGYEPYFLTVYDVVRFARSRGILCQGRGSAANSAVCYALGITEVDPSRMEMLFERFVSRERNEPPDIDVDFEHERREEVIQYIYRKYGRDRAALAATVITYQPKSALRDAGKALGLDLDQVDRIAKNFAWWDRHDRRGQRLRETGFDPESPVIERLLRLTDTLIGFPRHLSQHVGGFVVSRGPLSRLVPIENAAMENRTVLQWDKDDLDALGLLKVDVLALGMLTAIRRALDTVGHLRGRPFTLADIPPEDPAVYEMIGRADTVGVFQIESRAQMSMLPRLKPKNFYDLVIEVAIVRPGPIQGGMVHPYLRRRQGLEPVTYPSEAIKKVLERTLGVPIFQEQVMQLAIVAAGFTPGEADQLRRSMATWRRKGGLEKFEARLKAGMLGRGYSSEFAERIFRQIQGFGEYGFPESHAASFALLVYVSAWLKRYEPAAFTAALLNSQPMGFYAPAQLVRDAREHGVEVRPVDVFASQWDCTLEEAVPSTEYWTPGENQQSRCSGTENPQGADKNETTASNRRPQPPHPSLRAASSPAIRLGLRMVNGLSEAGAKRLIEARAGGNFASVEELLVAARLSRRDRDCLAAANAFSRATGHRRNAAWRVSVIEPGPPLLAHAPIHETPVELPAASEGEDIVADYASLGLTLGRHPLALLRPRLTRLRLLTAAELRRAPDGAPVRAAGIVTCRQRPGTASGVVFVTLEDETGFINVVVWGRTVEAQHRPLLGARLMAVHGHVQREGEVVHLVAGRILDYSHFLGDLLTRSRDFH